MPGTDFDVRADDRVRSDFDRAVQFGFRIDYCTGMNRHQASTFWATTPPRISKPGRIKVTEKAPVSEYQTRYSDIDINGHVNSIKYIEHILDLFPIEFFKEKRIKRFEMAYVAESYYGDILSFYREEVEEKEYDIEVKKNGTDVVVRSKVIFI